MADEPEEGLGEIELAESCDAEWFEVEDGYIIFPHGTEWFAECYDASAIRVNMKKRDVEIMDCESGAWRKPSQGKPSAQVRELNRKP